MHKPSRRVPVRTAAVFVGALVVAGAVLASLGAPAAQPETPTPVLPARATVGQAAPGTPSGSRTPVVAPPASAPTGTSRYRLSGVMAANGKARSGFALISIDGGPAHLFRVGAPVGSDLVLQSVGASSASLAAPGGRPMVVLELGQPGAASGPKTSAVQPRAVQPKPPPSAASAVPDFMSPEGSSEAPPHSN